MEAARGRRGGGASCLGVGRPGSVALPTPTARPLGGLPGPTTNWLWVRGGAGAGTRHQPHSARFCVLWGRHEGARGGRLLPGCGASGVGRSPTPDCPPSGRAAGAHYPLAVGEGGVRAWGPVTNPTARALASRLCALWGRNEGARGRRLLPGCGASGVGRSPTPDLLSSRACGRGPLPTGRGCGVRAWGRAVLGTLSRAPGLRVLCALPAFAAPGGRCGLAPVLVLWLWPAACLSGLPRGPALLRRSSSGLVPLGAPVGPPVAVVPSPTPGAVAPGSTGWLRGTRGGQPRTGLIVPAAGPCRGKGAGRAPHRTRSGPRDGVVSGGSLRVGSWAACAAVVWRVWTRSLTRPVSRTVRLATGDSAGAHGLFRVDADTAPFGSEDATPRSLACVRVRPLLGLVGRAGLPGAFWCASPFFSPFLVPSLLLRPLRAWVAPFVVFFLFLFPFSPLLRPRCVLLCVFSGPGCLGPWRLVPPPPPTPFFCLLPLCAPCCLLHGMFSGLGCPGPWRLVAPPPFFFAPPPPCGLWRFLLSWCLGPLRPPSPFFVFFPWFLVFPLSVFFPFSFPSFFAGCAVRGGFVCLGPSGVPRRCCPCRCSVCAGWCCVVLAVGPGCPLPSPGGSWCRASVVLSLSGRVARRPVVRRGVSWCSAALCCVLLRGAVVWWCAVVLCCLSGSLPVPVISFLPLRVCCVCSGVSCCVFPVLPVRCAVRLVCAGAPALCCSFFSPCWWRWFPVVLRWFWAPGRFLVVSVSVLCLCGAVLVCLRRCSLFAALLPSQGWLVFCVVACCVCVFAVGPGCPLLSPGGSWWLLVSCLGGVLWCVPGCCAGPCCYVLCRLALCCCALCCFVLLRLVLPRAVLCPVALSVFLGSCAFRRRVLSCPPALCVFCCGVSPRGVVRCCALCCVRPVVSCCAFPVVSALCGVAVWPALPRCPAPLCCAPWCCAAAWCRGVLPCRLVGFVSCVGVVVPT